MPQKTKKDCSCQCHTHADCCHGFGCGDRNCCSEPHIKNKLWLTRIDSGKKKKIILQIKKDSRLISTEDQLLDWHQNMPGVPEHITKMLGRDISSMAMFACQFDSDLDINATKQWAIDILEQWL